MSLEVEDERSLLAKINESASSLLDRKYILDARDKLIRLKQNRQTDIATAVAVVGTCPDMCPEQERYFRIDTKQISSFELDYTQDPNGVTSEIRMVKEYRRSGADQKEPLPYELRPIHVLERTMNYLCLEIIDQYEDCPNIGDWFDFVWSRTRSIRKDITQQHLINLKSVALIEKCARFHIFCSFYLCEEEVRDFDPKINEENLSNCLQTLKDFYYDLSIRSIYCQNESEFRAYDILLNLRNGETLSELKHFRKEIRNTHDVKFAVQIYQAFNSKNYIKFFQQTRRANFFQSCILNRYFNPFRIELFNIMRKAYTIPKSGHSVVSYPAADIVDQFAFDDFNELCNFCDKVGLKYDNEYIEIRRNFIIEDDNIKGRSKVLVWDKMDTTAGRSIIGDSDRLTIQAELLPVHSSFNNQNRLVFDQSTLTTSSSEVPIQKSQVVTIPSVETPSSISTNNALSFDNNIFGTKINSETALPKFSFTSQIDKLPSNSWNENFKPGVFFNATKPNNTQNTTSEQSSQFVFSLPNQQTQPTPFSNALLFRKPVEETPVVVTPAKPTIDYSILIDDFKYDVFEDIVEVLIYQQCDQTLKHIRKLRHNSRQLSIKLFETFIRSIIRNIATQVIEKQQLKKQLTKKFSFNFREFLLSQVVKMAINDIYLDLKCSNFKKRVTLVANSFYHEIYRDILTDLVRQVYQQQLKVRDQQIQQWRNNFLQYKFWCKWRKFYLKRRTLKFYRDTFPAAPTNKPNTSHFLLTQNTVIDPRFIKSNNSLKRKLVYSKYNDTDEIKKHIRQQLSKHPSPIESKYQSTIELPKRECFLERKYFKIWFNKVRKAKYQFVRTQFPAAPIFAKQRSSNSLSNFRSIIDDDIRRANFSIQKKLLQKLNCDYDSIDIIKRKLDEHEQRKAAQELTNGNSINSIRSNSQLSSSVESIVQAVPSSNYFMPYFMSKNS